MVDEKTIEHQFDSFRKTVLRNYARDIYDENKHRNDYLVFLESLSLAELSKLSILDDYDSNYICMVSYDYNIRIEDVLMTQAIGKLTNEKIIKFNIIFFYKKQIPMIFRLLTKAIRLFCNFHFENTALFSIPLSCIKIINIRHHIHNFL